MESGSDNTSNIYLNWVASHYDKFADSFESTRNPYSEKVGSYQRTPAWQKILDGRETVSKILKDNKIDAVMYMNCFDVATEEKFFMNSDNYSPAGYDNIFGSKLGFPDISIPMGFSDTDSKYTSEMPLGLSVFADFGQEKTLMNIAYAYEKQAGDFIRRMPKITPALEDETLSTFLDNLIDTAYSIDYSRYPNGKPEGKVRVMINACEKAKDVDTKDPYATYDAAKKIAEALDKVIAALKG